jgi:hypothetical protein
MGTNYDITCRAEQLLYGQIPSMAYYIVIVMSFSSQGLKAV